MSGFPKEVLFNNGEGCCFEDINNISRYLYASFGDGLLSHVSSQSDLVQPGASTAHLYAIGNSGAPFAGVATRSAAHLGGLIAQRISSFAPTGDDPQLLTYFLTADEATSVRPAATTNPRWDILTVRLTQVETATTLRDFKDATNGIITTQTLNKERRVTATPVWTQGVENASPVEPATPSNHVKIAAFRVSPGMTTFNPITDIRDYRMPVGGARSLLSRAWGYERNAAGDSPYNVFFPNGVQNTSGALTSDRAALFCPVASPSMRVVRVGLQSNRISGAVGAAVLELHRVSTGEVFTSLRTLTSLLVPSGTTPAYADFDILASHGEPLWSNGFAAGYACEVGGSPNNTLALRFQPGGDGNTIVLRNVRWTVVG